VNVPEDIQVSEPCNGWAEPPMIPNKSMGIRKNHKS